MKNKTSLLSLALLLSFYVVSAQNLKSKPIQKELTADLKNQRISLKKYRDKFPGKSEFLFIASIRSRELALVALKDPNFVIARYDTLNSRELQLFELGGQSNMPDKIIVLEQKAGSSLNKRFLYIYKLASFDSTIEALSENVLLFERDSLISQPVESYLWMTFNPRIEENQANESKKEEISTELIQEPLTLSSFSQPSKNKMIIIPGKCSIQLTVEGETKDDGDIVSFFLNGKEMKKVFFRYEPVEILVNTGDLVKFVVVSEGKNPLCVIRLSNNESEEKWNMEARIGETMEIVVQ